MPSRAPHGVAGRDAAGGSALEELGPAQRALVIRLPATVLVAANAGRTGVAESLAGLNALAAGSDLPSPLVRDVVCAIFAEADPVAAAGIPDGADIGSSCHSVARVLAAGVPAAESQAYRAWLQSIARCAGSESVGNAIAAAFRAP